MRGGHTAESLVSGVPRGSPGRQSFLPQPYAAFAVCDGGKHPAIGGARSSV